MGDESKITRRRALLAGGGTLAFGGGVAYVASRSGSSDEGYVPATSHTSDETTSFGIELAGRPIAGERDAAVDLYYWTDYLCPFCREFETETFPELGRNYIDTGDVRIVALYMPNIGRYSMPAAIWGRCVWSQVANTEPSAFWNWHSAAFDEQPNSGKDWADDETFAGVTERTDGVNLPAVETCREERGESIRESMDPNLGVAHEARIQGTPGFVIYNRESEAAVKAVGAQPYENFADAIDEVLRS